MYSEITYEINLNQVTVMRKKTIVVILLSLFGQSTLKHNVLWKDESFSERKV